ncbi:MAG TPA: cytochrome c3 family protein [Noviherbaspirillum sp.]|nr:cytochrome c3 family protein [Noviherbaspirillum sp.]
MKAPLKRVVSRLAAVSMLSAAAIGIFGGQSAVAGIADTKHNLGSQQTKTGFNKFDGSGEICVFCHTPHAADIAAQAPLWNRVATASPTYATYSSLGTLSLDGGSLAIGSTSAACLSCHDGTQAMNTVYNAPGSGLTAAADSTWKTGGWSGDNVGADGKMTGLAAVAKDTEGLKNDHPVSIQYAGGPKVAANIPAAPGDYTKTNFNDADFKTAKSTAMNGKQVWWVEADTDGVRTKKDLPLYTRSGTLTFADTTKSGTVDAAAPQPFVECASCHDPHSSNATFLRVPNTNSAVCLACHDK